MVLFLTDTDQQTPGTVSTRECGFINGGAGAVWTYSAASTDHQVQLPLDDGSGVPLGQRVRAGQSGFLQIDVHNTTGDTLEASVVLNAHAHEAGAAVTRAGTYLTYNTRIDIAPGSPASPTMATVTDTCPTSDETGAVPKFWMMSTHTHKQGIHTSVKDGDLVVFDSTSWREPGQQAWTRAPFYTFATGELTYQCEYSNPNNYRVETGERAADAEVCMVIGYYFPAVDDAGYYCLNRTLQ
jgi:hypothetical protein